MNYVIAGLIAFVSVFFKALQNRNYNFDNYYMILPTSWAIAACELYLLSIFIRDGIDIVYVLVVGTGSGLGGMLAMKVHSHYLKVKKVPPCIGLFKKIFRMRIRQES